MIRSKSTSVALLSVVLLIASTEAFATDPVCGDVNETKTVTSTDALMVLLRAVDPSVVLTCEADVALAQCKDDLAACTGGAVARLLKTGQTVCFDEVGTSISCLDTGQDGEVQYGAALSYTDNGDGTITDNSTGLMWEKLDNNNVGGIHDQDNIYTWPEAFGKVAELNAASFAGYTDWRVPNRRELDSLITIEYKNPAVDPIFRTSCVPGCVSTTCSCQQSFGYLSSSSLLQNPAMAYGINFWDGTDIIPAKSVAYGVRAVRTVP